MSNIGKYSFVKHENGHFDMLLNGDKVGAYFTSTYHPDLYGGYIVNLNTYGNVYMSDPTELEEILVRIHMAHNMSMNRNNESIDDRILRVENMLQNVLTILKNNRMETAP